MAQPTRTTPDDLLSAAASQIRPPAQAPQPTTRQAKDVGSGFWMPPLFLGAVLFSAYLLLKKPDALWPYVMGGFFTITFGWFIVSTLWPRFAERTCPTCGKNGLVPLTKNTHRGLRCTLCGFEDESLSSFFIAEEDGVLEETVMRERGRAPQINETRGGKS